jgi:chitinase
MPDGSIAQTDSWADENILKGDPDWNLGGYKPNTSLIDLAHNKGVKVLASVGGWTMSNDYHTIAANDVSRQKFADECVRLIKEFNFNGIDIDWEYPTYTDHGGIPADMQNFTLLLQNIRSTIDAYGKTVGKTYLLSACFSADPKLAAAIEWAKVKGILNMINLMTYDFFGAWDAVSNHNAPLYAPAQGTPTFNINSGFKMLTQQYGIPAGQINLGMAFYGRSFAKCNGLFQSHSGPDTQLYSVDEGIPTYYNIVKNFSTFTRYWDSQALVPYAIGGPSSTLISYDDEESIGIKADYIVKNDARGCIIWEITGDYIEGAPGTPLANKIKNVFCSIVTTNHLIENKENISFAIHPNPVVDMVFIESSTATSVRIFNMAGQMVFEKTMTSQLQVNFQDMAKGSYICILKNSYNIVIGKKIFIH